MLKIKHNQNGITIISLVTALIILIILAGIGISAVVRGGLIKKASEAKENTITTVEDIYTGFNELYDERHTHRQ